MVFGQKLWLKLEISMSNGFLDLKYIDIGEKSIKITNKIEEIRIYTMISYSWTLADPYDQFFGMQTAKNT